MFFSWLTRSLEPQKKKRKECLVPSTDRWLLGGDAKWRYLVEQSHDRSSIASPNWPRGRERSMHTPHAHTTRWSARSHHVPMAGHLYAWYRQGRYVTSSIINDHCTHAYMSASLALAPSGSSEGVVPSVHDFNLQTVVQEVVNLVVGGLNSFAFGKQAQ